MIDIKSIKAAHQIAEVIGRYVELKPDGNEFRALCPFHSENTPSFTVVPDKDFYYCFGCGAKGDVVDFVSEYHGIDKGNKTWVDQVASALGGAIHVDMPRPKAKDIKPDAAELWIPITPVPSDAPSIKGADGWTIKIFNPKRGTSPAFKPKKVYAYRNAAGAIMGYVLRCEFEDGGKFTPQITYCSGPDDVKQWCMVSMPLPRPLYGLPELAARPEAKVLIVEGEKCKLAAEKLLPDYVSISWCGGTNGYKYADWSYLSGRQVLLWPDADEPGKETMAAIGAILHSKDCHVIVISPADKQKGWDCADALQEGWTPDKTMAWIKANCKKYQAHADTKKLVGDEVQATSLHKIDSTIQGGVLPNTTTKQKNRPALRSIDGGKTSGNTAIKENPEPDSSPWFKVWSELKLDVNHNDMPLTNLNNAVKIIDGYSVFKGHIWYDEFHAKYYTDWITGVSREWADHDTLDLAVYIQRHLGITKITDEMLHKAVITVGKKHPRNEPMEWMESLKWDQIPRVKMSFCNYFGAAENEYTLAAARNFWISMVARVCEPGCQVDNMVILEADQGLGKTSALRIIGGKWHTEAHESVMSKDFYMALQGKFIVEIGEMDSFSRAETTKVKGVITCRSDRFRAPYARSTSDFPRRNIFVGTTNDDAYLRDHTGGRRFWPIKCGDLIDYAKLQMDRDQLFAEAVELFKSGEPWYKMPTGATEAEQEKRRVGDIWEDIVTEYTHMMTEVTTRQILEYALKVELNKADMGMQFRLGRIMRVLGWEKKMHADNVGIKQDQNSLNIIWTRRKVSPG